jgi:peptidoglycan/LPS O-acetylase OafA/YrhL
MMSAGIGTKNRLGNLDLLRIAAALLVLMYHFTYVGHAARGISPLAFPEIDRFTEHLWAGVSFFFMISGFVIAFSAERATAYDFMVSRIARLYPAFLFCMTLTAIILLTMAPQHFVEFQVDSKRWAANLTMLPILFKQPFVDGAYWSIVTEITFYFWVTVFIAFGLYQKHLMRILAAWLLLSAGNEFLLGSPLVNKLFATQYACYFVLGILSYRAFSQARRLSLPEYAVGLLAILLCLKSDHQVQNWMIANYSNATEWSWVSSLLKTAAFLALLNIAVRVPPLLPSQYSTTIGGLTYPLYLLHSYIGFTLFHHLDGGVFGFNRWVSLFFVTSLMMGLAYGVYRFIEPTGRRLIFAMFNAMKPRLLRAAPILAR